jgi:hypothetical protein
MSKIMELSLVQENDGTILQAGGFDLDLCSAGHVVNRFVNSFK